MLVTTAVVATAVVAVAVVAVAVVAITVVEECVVLHIRFPLRSAPCSTGQRTARVLSWYSGARRTAWP